MSTGSENYMKMVEAAYKQRYKLPSFQRDFKWNKKQVILLFDSIRQGFPLGSIILLSGSKEELSPRAFRGSSSEFDSADSESLVLDGQQRLTAGIDLFYGDMEESASQYFLDLDRIEQALSDAGVDIDNEDEVKSFCRELDTDTAYCVARRKIQNPDKLLIDKSLLRTDLLRPDNGRKREAQVEAYLAKFPERKKLIRNVVMPEFIISEAPDIPYVSVRSDNDLEAISRIFTTLNSSGKVLTPFELVVAVMYSQDIDLREDLKYLQEKHDYLSFMDPSGEILLQTVALLNGAHHKKTLLPKSLKPEHWRNDKEKAAELLSKVGNFLTDQMGMGLNLTKDLITYDSIFAPLAIVFNKIQYASVTDSTRKANFNRKLRKWVVGAALSQRYQEGVHTKQKQDAEHLVDWLRNSDNAGEPIWLTEVLVPSLVNVSSRGAIGSLIKCLLNQETMRDPMTNNRVNFGDQQTELHHIFPKKFLHQLEGWDPDRNKPDSVMNLMLVERPTNQGWLTQDPVNQLESSLNHLGETARADIYKKHGISPAAMEILMKSKKKRSTYEEFLKKRADHFYALIEEFGFGDQTGDLPDDNEEDA